MKALILSIIASSPPQDYLLPNTFLEGQCLHFLICITALDIRMTLFKLPEACGAFSQLGCRD